MGIPKFYRWLSERYPLLNQPTDVGETPVVDNLYLDMNGIIHNCTHGNTPGQTLTEAEMIAKIFTYLDKLFHVVKPQKLLFMAIDGSAPRAKMNQQRSRRFRSSRDAEEAKAEAARKGDIVPDDAFDSNCITPGTPFMARLGAHFRFFVRKKISEDPAWQRPHVIFSGHDVPGEGEHKIMEHIRHQKKRPDYVPNQRHCLYGLDADLIMLALVSHEPHFCLLREVVNFSGGARGRPSREVLDNPCQEHFMLFQIGLLREYLELEFRNPSLPFPYDVERVIDDFVLFCMLIGNDFLPALPTLDIAEGALDKLFAIYKELLPSMGGYLTHAGQLHRGRLEMILQRLAALELDTLEQRAQDAEYMEQKKNDREARGNKGWSSQARQQELDESDRLQAEIDAMANGTADLVTAAKLEGLEDEGGAGAGPTMMGRQARQLMMSGQGDAGLQAFKAKYYQEKLGVHKHDPAGRRKVVHAFIEGLHWVLEYYYRGVASWTWFFPYHYAPMISDMEGIEEFHVAFQQGTPFLPFQQLLGVLPSASHKLLPEPYQQLLEVLPIASHMLLPEAYQWLMTDANSPIADFYPTDFRVDMEGKRNEWEGVVLVPFIDEARLLAAHSSIGPTKLTKEEQARNTLGDMLVFSYQEDSTEDTFCSSTLPSHFGDVAHCNSRCVRQAPLPPLPAGQPGFVPQVMAGTRVGVGSPAGYPTLKTLVLTAALQLAGVEVFGQGSRKESLVLQVVDKISAAVEAGLMSAEQVAGSILGQRCWVRWPYLQEALVIAVSDRNAKVTVNNGVVRHDDKAAADWSSSAAQLTRQFLVKHGVDVGRSELVLHVQPLEGLMRRLDGTVEKRFAKKEMLYPLQASLRRNPAPDPRWDPSAMENALGPLTFEVGQKAVFLGRAYYGCVATVLPDVSAGLTRKGTKLAAATGGMLHITVQAAPAAAATAQATAKRVIGGVRVQYMPSGLAARKLQMSPRSLGKLTGNLWVSTGDERVDLGLCVKHGAKSMCVPDYVQAQPDNTGWTYSQALITVVEQYKRHHSWVFTMVDAETESNEYPLSQVFPGMSKEAAVQKVKQVKAWLQSLPLAKRPLVKTTVQMASEDAVRALQQALPLGLSKPQAPVELENVKPTLLLPPTEKRGIASELAGGLFALGDRVACLRASGTPPLGSRGTVVGIHEGAIEVLFDADYIGGGDLHGRCQGQCGGMLPPADLLNLAKPHFSNLTGADAPRQVGKTPPPGFGTPAPQAKTPPTSIQLVADSLANGHNKGPVGDVQSGEATPARQASIGQARPSPRHKTPQPQCPPHKDAKGFTMGRGRAILPSAPAAPGSSSFLVQRLPDANSFQFAAPGNAATVSNVPTAASTQQSSATAGRQQQDNAQSTATPLSGDLAGSSLEQTNPGQQLLRQLQQHQARECAQSQIGQTFLQQLQQPQARESASSQIGQAFLQQLQQSRAKESAPPQIGQAFLQQLQAGPARPTPSTDLGKGLLHHLQQGSAPTSLPGATAQHAAAGGVSVGVNNSNAGRALLSQLQRPVAQPNATPTASAILGTLARPSPVGPDISSAAAQQQHSMPIQTQYAVQSAQHTQSAQLAEAAHPAQARQLNPGMMLLEQLQGPSPSASAPPARHSPAMSQVPPGFPLSVTNMADASAMSFQQMLRAALMKQDHSQTPLGPTHPTSDQRLSQSSQATSLASHLSTPPGFPSNSGAPTSPDLAPPPHVMPAQQRNTTAGRQLLQQLQHAGQHNQSAGLHQPSNTATAVAALQHLPAMLSPSPGSGQAPAGQLAAGQRLLQQLQRGAGSASLATAAPAVDNGSWLQPSNAAVSDGFEAQPDTAAVGVGGAVVGMVPEAVQPKPSAPPAPTAVLLQQAAGQNGIALPYGQGQGRAAGRGRGRTGGLRGRGAHPNRQLQPHNGPPGLPQQRPSMQQRQQQHASHDQNLQQPSQPMKLLTRGAPSASGNATAAALPPPVDDLAALWAQLQLKHTQEAAAASMSRKASAEHQVPKSPAVAQQVARNVQKQPDNAANVQKSEVRPETGSTPNDRASGRAASSSNVPQQQSSEESFWKMMQQ